MCAVLARNDLTLGGIKRPIANIIHDTCIKQIIILQNNRKLGSVLFKIKVPNIYTVYTYITFLRIEEPHQQIN